MDKAVIHLFITSIFTFDHLAQLPLANVHSSELLARSVIFTGNDLRLP